MFSLSLTLPKLRLSTRGSHDVANSTRMNYKDGSYCGTFLVRHWRRSFAPRAPDYSLFSARECFNVPRGAHPSSSQWRHVTRLRQGARVVLSLPPQHICLKLPALNNNFQCVCVCVCACVRVCVGVPVRVRLRTCINTSAYNNKFHKLPLSCTLIQKKQWHERLRLRREKLGKSNASAILQKRVFQRTQLFYTC